MLKFTKSYLIQADNSCFFFSSSSHISPAANDPEALIACKANAQILPYIAETIETRIQLKSFCPRICDSYFNRRHRIIFIFNNQWNGHTRILSRRAQEIDSSLVEVNLYDVADKEVHANVSADIVTS